jgi:hypothetical protein
MPIGLDFDFNDQLSVSTIEAFQTTESRRLFRTMHAVGTHSHASWTEVHCTSPAMPHK